jgi:Nitroreductase
MEVSTAVTGRRSIRMYKPDQVSRDIIQEILEEARWAPSWGNTQVWEFYVVIGDTLEKFKEANLEKLQTGATSSPEISMPEKWPEKPNERYTEFGKRLLNALNIPRKAKDLRDELYAKMFNLFGAPCLMVACLDKGISLDYGMLDIGLILQTICLLAHEKGLGTTIMAVSVMYPEVLRKLLSIPDTKVIVMGVALGYPDWNAPANKFERSRANLEELVTWVG